MNYKNSTCWLFWDFFIVIITLWIMMRTFIVIVIFENIGDSRVNEHKFSVPLTTTKAKKNNRAPENERAPKHTIANTTEFEKVQKSPSLFCNTLRSSWLRQENETNDHHTKNKIRTSMHNKNFGFYNHVTI